MRKILFLMVSLLIISCTQLIDEPKNLVEKDKMSEIIAEFAINEQLGSIETDLNLDNATRFTLKKYKIKGKDFIDSYQYYTATGDIENVLNNAQTIILNKDPKAKIYLDKKIKENKNTPAFSQ